MPTIEIWRGFEIHFSRRFPTTWFLILITNIPGKKDNNLAFVKTLKNSEIILPIFYISSS